MRYPYFKNDFNQAKMALGQGIEIATNKEEKNRIKNNPIGSKLKKPIHLS